MVGRRKEEGGEDRGTVCEEQPTREDGGGGRDEIKARRLIRILLEKFPFPENALRALSSSY